MYGFEGGCLGDYAHGLYNAIERFFCGVLGMHRYVHGYSARETRRLYDQARILEDLLHKDTRFPDGSRVLEVGCGVGAQTVILAEHSPEATIEAVDISLDSLREARNAINRDGISGASFYQTDILSLPFAGESFDHVFVCFVLEHFTRPLDVLLELKRVLRKGGTLTVIEGDHGSCFWYPCTEYSRRVWRCLVEAQARLGHNSLVGRELYPLLMKSGFGIRYVSPRWVYVDGAHPGLMLDVIGKIIAPMVDSSREQSIGIGMIDRASWLEGMKDLHRLIDSPESTFFYSWFKGVARK